MPQRPVSERFTAERPARVACVRELFIYYRVSVADEAAACRAVIEMQSALCREHPGLQARVLRRPEFADDRSTLMEIYRLPASVTGAAASDLDARNERAALAVADATFANAAHATVAAAIEAAAADRAIGRWLQGGRHVEVFLSCA